MKSDKNIREGYKKTAVGVIPEEWEVKKLKELVTIQNGRGYSHLEKGDIPVYASGGIINYVNKPLYEGTSIGIGRKGTIDSPQLLTGKYWVIDTLFFMNDFKDVYPYFLYSKFQEVNWYRYNETSGLPSLIKNTIQKVQFAIPPLPEQQAIANCLTTWDSGIEKLTQLIAAKREQKKGLMQQLLTGKKRLDGFVGEWKEVRLTKVIKLQGGFAFKSNEFKKTGIPIIRISNLSAKSSKVDLSDVVYYSDINQSNFNVVNGDLLIAMSGATTGKTAVYKGSDHAYLNQRVGLFKNKNSNKFDYRILYYIVQTNYFNSEITKMLSTGAQPNISSSDIENIRINLPLNIDEQMAIADILSTADQEISLLEAKLAAMKEEKKGLMQVLLTGKKRLIDS